VEQHGLPRMEEQAGDPRAEHEPKTPPPPGDEEHEDAASEENTSGPLNASGTGTSGAISALELQKLESLSKSTTRNLNELWAEMGLSDEERARQLTLLVKQVEEVFVGKVRDETALRDEYVNAVAELEQEIDEISRQLGMERDYFPHGEKGNLMLKLSWLREHLADFEKLKEERLEKLEELRLKLQETWVQMGETELDKFLNLDKFLTPEGMEEYEAKVVEATHARTRRIAAIQEMIRDINNLFEELEYEIDDEIDKAIAQGGEGLGIDMDAVGVLSQRARELTDEKISRTERLKQLGSAIQPLWEKLEVDEGTRQRFFSENRGLGLNVIRQCEIELERLVQLKQEKMGVLIQTAQEKIQALWEEMQYNDEQREAFTEAYMMASVCEETLEAHESELEVLTVQVELYRPILKSIERYNQLCAEREEYEAKIQDSSRLLKRTRGNALREEEKQRQRVTQGLPKLVEKIKTSTQEYEKEHGPFILNGRRYLETIEENEEAHAKKLEEEKLRKRRAKDGAKGQTPLVKKGSGTMRKTPLGSKND